MTLIDFVHWGSAARTDRLVADSESERRCQSASSADGSSKLGVSCKFLLKSCGEVGGGDHAPCVEAAARVTVCVEASVRVAAARVGETAVNPE